MNVEVGGEVAVAVDAEVIGGVDVGIDDDDDDGVVVVVVGDFVGSLNHGESESYDERLTVEVKMEMAKDVLLNCKSSFLSKNCNILHPFYV